MKKKIYFLLLITLGAQAIQLANAQCKIVVNTTSICTRDTLSATVSSPVYELQWKLRDSVVHISNAAENKYGEIVAGGNGMGKNADQLNLPGKIFVDDTGNVYVADTYNNRIQKWAPGAIAGVTIPDSYGDAACVFVDKKGNIYFPDASAQVKKLAPGTTTSVVVAGSGTTGSGADQLSYIKDLFVDDTGNIYIADYSNFRVQKWAPGATSGVTVAGGNGQGLKQNQLEGPEGIYVDKQSNVYVADHGIQKWAPGAKRGVIVAGESDRVGYTDVSMDADGQFYVSESSAGSITKYAPGDVKGVVIAGGNGYESATNMLNWPQGLFLDGKGNVYASDQYNNRVLKFAIAQNDTYQYVPDQAGKYTVDASFTSGCNTSSNTVRVKASPTLQLSGTTTLCTGDSTTLTASGADAYSWSPSTGLNTTIGPVVKASPNADIIYTITASNANGCSAAATAALQVNPLPAVTITGNACSDTNTATVTHAAASMDWKLNGTIVQSAGAAWNADGIDVDEDGYVYYARSVFVDRNNNIYVSMGFEEDNNIVLKYSPGNPEPDIVAGSSTYGNGANQLQLPNDVWVDAQGNVYVADRDNQRIQKWSPGATSGVTVATGSSPTGVAVDGFGNIYVVENTAHDVMKWAPGATKGIRVAGGESGGSTADKLSGPIDVYVDGKGNLYITDAFNNRIQKWSPGATSGITVAGGNGKGKAANQLNSPSDVYADEQGNVYVCDYNNGRVQRWAPGASSGTTVLSFFSPNGISFDNEGNLYTVTYGGNLFKYAPLSNFKYAPQDSGTYTVTATSIDGCSTTGQVPGCNTCESPYNLSVSDIKIHSAHFQGNVSPGSILNQLRIRKVGTTQWDKYWGSRMEVTLHNLDANTVYQWQARSKCSNGLSEWVNGPNFKTRRAIPFPPYITKENVPLTKTGITVLPNPNQGNFTVLIKMTSKAGKVSIQLYDAAGKQVYEENAGILNGSTNKSINLQGHVAAGVYLLVAQTESERYTEKVVIVK